MNCVLQKWVLTLSLRYQGVLVASIRGCDGAPKLADAKVINRGLRRMILNPFDVRELQVPNEFFSATNEQVQFACASFVKNHDEYAHHYIMHLVHAAEIIGYEYPGAAPARTVVSTEKADDKKYLANIFWHFYWEMVRSFHMNPETRSELKARLESVRVPQGGDPIPGDE